CCGANACARPTQLPACSNPLCKKETEHAQKGNRGGRTRPPSQTARPSPRLPPTRRAKPIRIEPSPSRIHPWTDPTPTWRRRGPEAARGRRGHCKQTPIPPIWNAMCSAKFLVQFDIVWMDSLVTGVDLQASS
uniref:Uncharacterized protein n=1 Tax=Aegilops tauschii subsp. strangulata TaxID=200361 RepID=A0A453LBF7_AEGTS